MKKYIVGFVLSLALFSGGIAYAKIIAQSRWYVVDQLAGDPKYYRTYEKIFDEETNTVCYTVSQSWNTASISCLKNN